MMIDDDDNDNDDDDDDTVMMMMMMTLLICAWDSDQKNSETALSTTLSSQSCVHNVQT